MLRSATRSEQLLELVRLDIVRNGLRPGERVTEEALAERYGVSRTPVREALRVLTQESLLEYTPHIGYTVAAVDLDEMDDLYTVRVAIEAEVARQVGRRPTEGEELQSLLIAWDTSPRSPGEADIGIISADEHFHETLALASGSKVFPSMLRNINQRLHALRIRDFGDAERVRRTYEQHAEIVRTLLSGDARLGSALLRAHIWESHAFVRAAAQSDVEVNER